MMFYYYAKRLVVDDYIWKVKNLCSKVLMIWNRTKNVFSRLTRKRSEELGEVKPLSEPKFNWIWRAHGSTNLTEFDELLDVHGRFNCCHDGTWASIPSDHEIQQYIKTTVKSKQTNAAI